MITVNFATGRAAFEGAYLMAKAGKLPKLAKANGLWIVTY